MKWNIRGFINFDCVGWWSEMLLSVYLSSLVRSGEDQKRLGQADLKLKYIWPLLICSNIPVTFFVSNIYFQCVLNILLVIGCLLLMHLLAIFMCGFRWILIMYMAFFASNNTQCTDPVLVLKLPWSMRMIVETNDRLALLPNYWRERREEGGQSPTWISWFIWKHTNWLPWCWWGWDEEDEERIFRRLSFQRRLTSLWT